MGLPVHRPDQLRPRELDRTRGRGAPPPRAGRQRGRRRAGESVCAPVARGGRGHSPVRLRRLLYDPVKLQQELEGHPPAQILVRLRAGRRFYADPSLLAGPPAHTGRPRRHGPKMKCADPSTWPEPSTEYTCEDAGGYGAVRVRAWANLHPKVRAHEGRGSRVDLCPSWSGRWSLWRSSGCLAARGGASRASCGCGGMVPRKPRRTWSSSGGARTSGASTCWSTHLPLPQANVRMDHPSGAPSRAGRSVDVGLVVAAFTQLRLARPCVEDRRLPWERHYDPGRLTPIRVHRVVSALLMELGTPARPPKPCGRSPGRPKGRLSGRAKRYPALKKTA